MDLFTLRGFQDELEKIALSHASEDPTRSDDVFNVVPRAAEEYGKKLESRGRLVRNVAYPASALALASSFIPSVNKNDLARMGLRTGAALGGLVGYGGELGMHQGRGYLAGAQYLRTGNVPEGEGLVYSPSVFKTVVNTHRQLVDPYPPVKKDELEKVSRGVAGNALSKRASLGDYKDMLMKALRNPETMKKLHPQEQKDALHHGLAQVFLKSPSLPSSSRITTQTMFPAVTRR